MNDLLVVKNGEPLAPSDRIASNTMNDHKSVLQLIRTYLSDFEEFGRVTFEVRPFETAGGMQDRTIAFLNEDQATLLLTYLRNNVIVRAFKVHLVKAFSALKKAATPAIPMTYAAALRIAADQAEQIEQQQAALALAAPKVEFVDRYVESSTGAKGFRQVCKLLGAKEPEFREFLETRKIMYRLNGEWTAYAYHLDVGRFEVKTGTAAVSDHAYAATKFTPKGIAWISTLWAQRNDRGVAA